MKELTDSLSQLRFWKVAALSFFLGLLLATTFAPLHLVFFLPVCFSGLLILFGTAKTKSQAFFVGWWFGWGQFIAGLYWIGIAFTIDANAHAALIPLPTLGLPAFLAIFSGLATLATYLVNVRSLYRILAFSGFWVLFEYARGLVFTGFPWNLAGYSWGNVLPMLQWVSYIGIYGLTLVTVLISSIPALLTDKSLSTSKKNTLILLDCLFLAVLIAVGYARIPNTPLEMFADSQIRIVQPNIQQAEKWKADKKLGHVKKLVELSKQETGIKPKYLIWPETAVPYFLTTDENLIFYLQRIVPENGRLITGAPRKNAHSKQYWNSVQILDQAGNINGIYDKRHLVPYGEYMPLRNFTKAIGLTSLIPALDKMSDFSLPSETSPKTLDIPGLGSARILICYEVAFPWEMQSDTSFNWILNVTNDAWFGKTSGPYQHLVIAKTRAVEQGMSVVRAANSGVSAIFDGYGRLLQMIPLDESGIIDSSIPQALDGGTLYKKHGELIPVFLVLLIIVSGLIGKRIKSQ
ncbi:MAG: apolipoprotein N-acyltransferase [Sneathiella sp.]|nr:apolipoprotein N-acyltransferase [Sneathiella sp.]